MADPAALFWIDDAQWLLIEPLLKQADRAASGPRSFEDRITLSGIVHVLKSGSAWRDCPGIYGGYLTLVNRYKLLKHTRALVDILAVLDVEVAPPRQLDLAIDHRGPAAAVVPAASPQPTASRPARAPAPVTEKEAHPGQDAPPRGVSARDIAAAHIRQLAALKGGQLADSWVDDIVSWHLEFVEQARVGFWVPGMLGSADSDSMVRKAVTQFHLHQVQTTIERLTVEAHKQRIALLRAMACIDYYASQSSNPAVAREALRSLRGAYNPSSNGAGHMSTTTLGSKAAAPSANHQ